MSTGLPANSKVVGLLTGSTERKLGDRHSRQRRCIDGSTPISDAKPRWGRNLDSGRSWDTKPESYRMGARSQFPGHGTYRV